MTRRVAVLTLAALLLLGGAASAEPISLLDYERALVEVRVELDLAREADGETRGDALRRATSILDASREVRVGSAVYTAAPHGALRALLARGDTESLMLATEVVREMLAAVHAASAGGGLDPTRARGDLEAILRSPDFRRAPDWRDAVAAFIRDRLASIFPGLRAPRFTQDQITLVAGVAGIALLSVVAWSTLRGARAKIAREVLLAGRTEARGPSAAEHLRAAGEARRAGRLREALRELFLAALEGLEHRGALAHDPALTDRELLARAAGSPSAGDLETLVGLYERAWYGLREPRDEDVDRADELARRIGA